MAEIGGDPVLIARNDDRGGPDDGLLVIDLSTGEHRHTLREPGHVAAVAAGDLDGVPVAVSNHTAYGEDNVLQVWDLATGARLHRLAGHDGRINGIATGELAGTPVAVSCSTRDRTVRVWDLTTGRQLGEPFGQPDAYDECRGLTVTEVNGRTMVLVGIRGGLEVWDISAGDEPVLDQLITNPSTEPDYSHQTVAVWHRDGTPIVLFAYPDERYRYEIGLWDLAAGEQVGSITADGHNLGRVGHIEVTELDGVPVAVAQHADAVPDGPWSIRVWDLTTAEQARAPLTGGADTATRLITVAELDGEALAITNDEDGRVLRWPLAER